MYIVQQFADDADIDAMIRNIQNITTRGSTLSAVNWRETRLLKKNMSKMAFAESYLRWKKKIVMYILYTISKGPMISVIICMV